MIEQRTPRESRVCRFEETKRTAFTNADYLCKIEETLAQLGRACVALHRGLGHMLELGLGLCTIDTVRSERTRNRTPKLMKAETTQI